MEAKRTNENDIQSVQSLLFGEQNEHITAAVRKEARAIVTEVITEALDDRQKQDTSLVNTITPLMEKAINKSIEHNKTSIINSLYPVLGGLVRKSVAAFFNRFLAKLNHLIEYSLTIKGIKWRFDAWRQGIAFSDYILKQSLVYRVESAFLIHRPSGTLLCHAQIDESQCNDPQLMSAMLSAISDFVADSFNNQQDIVLESINADKITLVIARAPHALLVAAVTGTVASELNQYLQHSLDNIHLNMSQELQTFSGETSVFEAAEEELNQCLIAESKPIVKPITKSKKASWLLIAILIISCFILGNYALNSFHQAQLRNSIQSLTPPAGVIIQQLHWQQSKLHIHYLRDPAAPHFATWLSTQLANNNPLSEQLVLAEQPFISLAPEVVAQKIADLLIDTPIHFVFNNDQLTLSGQVNSQDYAQTLAQLKAIPGIANISSAELTQVSPASLSSRDKQSLAMQSMLAELALQPIDFASKSADIPNAMESRLDALAKQLKAISQLSVKLNNQLGIILTGYSDSSGSTALNQQLSQQRAENVKLALIARQVPSELLFAVGLGELPLSQVAKASRKVLLSSIVLTAESE